MKKAFFVFAALCAATFASAQIILENSIDIPKSSNNFRVGNFQSIKFYDCGIRMQSEYPCILGEYFVLSNSEYPSMNVTYSIYDTNFSIIKSGVKHVGKMESIVLSKGLFTSDEKWVYMHWLTDNNDGYTITITTEDDIEIFTTSNVLLSTPNGSVYSCILKVGDDYKLLLVKNVSQEDVNYRLEMYSLPGHGDSAQDVIAPATHRNTRKVLKKDQVQIENADKIYTLQGQEVR